MHKRRRLRRRFHRRGRRFGGPRPLVHAVAERAQDRGEILARAARKRRHADANGEPEALDCARRLRARSAGTPCERRADEIGEPLQDIDPHGARPAHPVTGGAVEHLCNLVVGGDRRAAAGGKLLDRVEALPFRAPIFERPELRRQRPRPRLEQRRQIDVIGAEAHAVLAQRRTRGLLQALDLVRNLVAIEHAERFGELERNATRDAGYVLSRGEPEQRLQESLDVGLEPQIEPRLHRVARRAGKMLVGDDAHARLERLFAGNELANGLSEPPDGPVGREHELPVRRLRQARCTRVDFPRQRLLRCAGERFRFGAGGRGSGREHESVETADRVPLDHDFPALGDVGLEHRVLA